MLSRVVGWVGVVQVSSTARTRAKKASEQRQAPLPPPIAAAAITATAAAAEKRTRRTRPETPSRSPPACWSPHVRTSSFFVCRVCCVCGTGETRRRKDATRTAHNRVAVCALTRGWCGWPGGVIAHHEIVREVGIIVGSSVSSRHVGLDLLGAASLPRLLLFVFVAHACACGSARQPA